MENYKVLDNTKDELGNVYNFVTNEVLNNLCKFMQNEVERKGRKYHISYDKCFLNKDGSLRDNAYKMDFPCYLYDERGIEDNARLVNNFHENFPNSKVYYAVKANANIEIIKTLIKCGCGLDCSSLNELKIAKMLKLKGDDIMFSSNYSPRGEFSFAHKLEATINFDAYEDIRKYLDEVGELPKKICLRFRPDNLPDELTNGIMSNPKDSKFGMTKDKIFESCKLLKELGITEVGLHAFLTSNSLNSVKYFSELMEMLATLGEELTKKFGLKIWLINLSGGMGVPYRPEDNENNLQDVFDAIKKVYTKHYGDNGPRIYTEWGRYMTAPYGALIANVTQIKHDSLPKVGISACASNLIRPAMYGDEAAYHHILVARNEKSPKTNDKQEVAVVGSLCESNDMFTKKRLLPKIAMDDIIIILTTGGHCFSMGYRYNGRLQSAEYLLKKDGSFDVIRKAEDFHDYLNSQCEIF